MDQGSALEGGDSNRPRICRRREQMQIDQGSPAGMQGILHASLPGLWRLQTLWARNWIDGFLQAPGI
jgi:hypothetical protein